MKKNLPRLPRVALQAVGIALLLVGCKALVVDPSITAAEAHDYTMVFSAGCQAVPSQGLDICRVVEGAKVAEHLRIVVPVDKVLSCEIRVRYKGVAKSFSCAANGNVALIPWRELVGGEFYERGDEGPAQLIGSARVKGPDGDRFVDVLGYAFLVVLGKGYSPMPIDSGNQAWGTNCKVQYSTAGRSALVCR